MLTDMLLVWEGGYFGLLYIIGSFFPSNAPAKFPLTGKPSAPIEVRFLASPLSLSGSALRRPSLATLKDDPTRWADYADCSKIKEKIEFTCGYSACSVSHVCHCVSCVKGCIVGMSPSVLACSITRMFVTCHLTQPLRGFPPCPRAQFSVKRTSRLFRLGGCVVNESRC